MRKSCKDMQGMRLDVALTKIFPDYSRTMLSAALKKGLILLDAHIAKPKDKVKGNEIITVANDFFTINALPNIEPEAIALHIIYEDEALLVVNKPVGLIVHPGAGNPNHTLVNALLYHNSTLSTLPRAGIIHRLDQNTSGLLLVAKTHAAYKTLTEAMKARQIKRMYFALVHGNIIRPNICQTFYGRCLNNRLKMAVRRSGKEAITLYQPIKNFSHFTLLNIELMTGRTHQIRVHMQYLKHPIVGDPMYGKSYQLIKDLHELIIQELGYFTHQALHAHSLIFDHPIMKNKLTLNAPLPDDFQSLLHMVEKYDL